VNHKMRVVEGSGDRVREAAISSGQLLALVDILDDFMSNHPAWLELSLPEALRERKLW
jgi:hypothetical protein